MNKTVKKIATKPTRVASATRKIRTSVFLERATLDAAADVAKLQTLADPLREEASVASVLRVSIAIGLESLKQKHLAPAVQ